MTNMPIGRLAKATDLKAPAIRFYEQIGLLPAPQRMESDRRVCGEAAVKRLAFVDEKIAQISVLKAELERMVGAGCTGEVADGRLIEALGDSALCDHHRPGLAGRAG